MPTRSRSKAPKKVRMDFMLLESVKREIRDEARARGTTSADLVRRWIEQGLHPKPPIPYSAGTGVASGKHE